MNTLQKLTAGTAVALALPLASFAQEDGRAVLERAINHAKSMSGFTVDFELELDLEVDAETENFTSDFTVAFNRPDNTFVYMNNRYQELSYYSSASSTTRVVPELEQYMVEDMGTPASELLKGAANQYTLPAIVIMAELTKENPLDNVLNGDAAIELLGQEDVNGISCDAIRFTYADFKVDVWVEQGDKALVHRIRPYLENEIKAIQERGGNVKKLDIDLRVMHWQPNQVDDDLLTYAADEGYEKVARFYRKPPPSPAEALVGQEAPEIELTRLNGEDFNLADYRGKIVLLDFWATWCGPCRIGMPILSKVAKEFEDKDVVLFAVNLQDEEAPIRSFLESSGLEDLKVVRDIEGVTMEPYMANSIPQMVVVGKDGIVKKVHVGVSPNYEEELRKEFTELTSE